MHRPTVFVLPLLAACTVGTADESVDPRPMPLLVGQTPVGSYQDRMVSLDPEFALALVASESGDAPISAGLILELEDGAFALDPADPVVAIPRPLEPGAELTLVVTAGGAPFEVAVAVGEPATEDALEVVCIPLYYPGYYYYEHCGFPCSSSQRYHEFWITACSGCDPNNCWTVVETGSCFSC